jgi:hypothetical protein
MFKVDIDLLKNRLYLTVGPINKDRLDSVIDEIAEAVDQLDRGFTCVTRVIDVRKLGEQDVLTVIKVQDLLTTKGVSMVARVGIVEGKQILDRIGEDAGYLAVNVESLADADGVLDKWAAKKHRHPESPSD